MIFDYDHDNNSNIEYDYNLITIIIMNINMKWLWSQHDSIIIWSWQSQPEKEHDGASNVYSGEVDEVGDEPAGGGVGRPGGSYLEIGDLANFGNILHWKLEIVRATLANFGNLLHRFSGLKIKGLVGHTWKLAGLDQLWQMSAIFLRGFLWVKKMQSFCQFPRTTWGWSTAQQIQNWP